MYAQGRIRRRGIFALPLCVSMATRCEAASLAKRKRSRLSNDAKFVIRSLDAILIRRDRIW